MQEFVLVPDARLIVIGLVLFDGWRVVDNIITQVES